MTKQTRPMGTMGRLLIPREIRLALHIHANSLVEITTDGNEIHLRRYDPGSPLANTLRDIRTAMSFSGYSPEDEGKILRHVEELERLLKRTEPSDKPKKNSNG